MKRQDPLFPPRYHLQGLVQQFWSYLRTTTNGKVKLYIKIAKLCVSQFSLTRVIDLAGINYLFIYKKRVEMKYKVSGQTWCLAGQLERQIWPYLLKVIGTAEIHQNGSQTETPRAEAAQEGRLHQLGGRQQPSRSQSYEKVGKNVNSSLLWRFESIQYVRQKKSTCRILGHLASIWVCH